MTRIPVLDHGFVELIDVMGDDAEVARAARISYGNTSDRAWEQDAKLTRYLWDNQHSTPFEMVELKFRMKMPIFVARQLVRHRTANINEFSMRYADPEKIAEGESIDFYTPTAWRGPDLVNKQGSVPQDVWDEFLYGNYQNQCEGAVAIYKRLQQYGVANEMARMVLPVSVYTEWVWKCDLKNTLHLIQLRTDSHAQWETQEYARAMLKLLREALPKLMEVVMPEA